MPRRARSPSTRSSPASADPPASRPSAQAEPTTTTTTGAISSTGVLRDRTGLTRVLMLAAMEEAPGITLSDIAARLEISVQAVWTHARQLAADGLISQGDEQRVSSAGRAFLHEHVRRLRAAVDEVSAPLALIRTTSAIAAGPIAAHAEVGLYMDGGDLYARAGHAAPSGGRAAHAAGAGDEVIVEDLAGMVALSPGRLSVVGVPSAEEGGIRHVDVPRLRARLRDLPAPHKTGAVGTGARVLAARLGPLDFEFAAERAAFNAAERGLDVRLYITRDRLADAMDVFQQANARTLKRVAIEQFDAPEVDAPAADAREGDAA